MSSTKLAVLTSVLYKVSLIIMIPGNAAMTLCIFIVHLTVFKSRSLFSTISLHLSNSSSDSYGYCIWQFISVANLKKSFASRILSFRCLMALLAFRLVVTPTPSHGPFPCTDSKWSHKHAYIYF